MCITFTQRQPNVFTRMLAYYYSITFLLFLRIFIYIKGTVTVCCHANQKAAVYGLFTSKQILAFGFAGRY